MIRLWKETILAGISTIGGLFLLTKNPVVKNAEMISFAAPRKFPKKVRLTNYAEIKQSPLKSMFDIEKGYYFARERYGPNDENKISYGGRNLKPQISWSSFSVKGISNRASGFLFDTENKYLLLSGHLFNLNLPLDRPGYNSIEFAPTMELSTYQSNGATVSTDYTKKLLSRQEFEDLWENHRGWGGNPVAMSRLEAYWALYTVGTLDGDMDDESVGGVYGEIDSFLEEILKQTYTKNDAKNELFLFEQIRDTMADLVMKGEDPLRGWDSSNVDLRINKEIYEPTLEEVKVMVEWFILRETLFWYLAWEENIKPLLEKGWSATNGAIVQNIRTKWDAYRNGNDAPERRDAYIDGIIPTIYTSALFSKGFVVKRILKKRNIFNQAIEEDVRKCNDALVAGNKKLGLESAEKILDGLLTTPPFSNMDYFDNFTNYDYYYDDFFAEINTLVSRAGDNLTDADRNAVKQKLAELIDYKENKTKEDAKTAYDEIVQSAQDDYDKILTDLIPQNRKKMERERDEKLEF